MGTRAKRGDRPARQSRRQCRVQSPLVVTSIEGADASMPMTVDISMGVRRTDRRLEAQVETALSSLAPQIKTILVSYGASRRRGVGRSISQLVAAAEADTEPFSRDLVCSQSGYKRRCQMTPRESEPQKETIERVMHEFKHGELRSGTNAQKVRSRKQAVAIALSEAGASNQQTPKENKAHLRRTKAKERRGETAQAEIEGKKPRRRSTK
jgi:hypothetical protein